MIGDPFGVIKGIGSRSLAEMLLWCLSVLEHHQAVTEEEAEKIKARIWLWLTMAWENKR